MIKFFRKIRQKLINEGNLKKYLIYAIGEILLVVIGILIALQINNWNENLKDRKDELNGLIDLKDEFINNRQRFQATIEDKRTTEKSWKEFLITLMNQKIPFEEKGDLWRGSPGYRTTNLTNSTLNALLTSRQIDKIENDSLKILLLGWNDIFNDYREEEIAHWKFVTEKLFEYEQLNFPTIKVGPWEKLKFYKDLYSESYFQSLLIQAYQDLYYRNLLLANHKWLVLQLIEGENVEEKIDLIIKYLESEINSKRK